MGQLEANKKEVKLKALSSKANGKASIVAKTTAAQAQAETKAAKAATTKIGAARKQILDAERAKVKQALGNPALRGSALGAEETKQTEQARVDVAKKAAAAAAKIESQTRATLEKDKGALKLKQKAAEAKLAKKQQEKKQASARLTATQIAKVRILVNTELAKRVVVCAKAAKTKPAEEMTIRSNLATDLYMME